MLWASVLSSSSSIFKFSLAGGLLQQAVGGGGSQQRIDSSPQNCFNSSFKVNWSALKCAVSPISVLTSSSFGSFQPCNVRCRDEGVWTDSARTRQCAFNGILVNGFMCNVVVCMSCVCVSVAMCWEGWDVEHRFTFSVLIMRLDGFNGFNGGWGGRRGAGYHWLSHANAECSPPAE